MKRDGFHFVHDEKSHKNVHKYNKYMPNSKLIGSYKNIYIEYKYKLDNNMKFF